MDLRHCLIINVIVCVINIRSYNMKTNPKGYNMFRECGKTKVILYKTIIVVFDGDTITLNSGGWRTAHTKKCMNIALKDSGYRVFQKKGDWYIRQGDKI